MINKDVIMSKERLDRLYGFAAQYVDKGDNPNSYGSKSEYDAAHTYSPNTVVALINHIRELEKELNSLGITDGTIVNELTNVSLPEILQGIENQFKHVEAMQEKYDTTTKVLFTMITNFGPKNTDENLDQIKNSD